MTLQSPWTPNVNPANPAPPVRAQSVDPESDSVNSVLQVPVNYTGTISSNNNGLPYRAGITGSNADCHTLPPGFEEPADDFARDLPRNGYSWNQLGCRDCSGPGRCSAERQRFEQQPVRRDAASQHLHHCYAADSEPAC